ncbi:MAG: pseudouridine-5'-phosphate glycosidase [Chloroflexota bacterium]|nr:pseudouridine-5'-phosphate glycosidase [Chloroflexota bacterium]
MFKKVNNHFHFSPEVSRAKHLNAPIVALETTVLTHGLPYPQNMELAQAMESEVQTEGATPATIGILDGVIRVGMNQEQLERLVAVENPRKISRRDFAPAIAKSDSGGTTVAGTLIVAHAAGIRTFATGGIGGVHRQPAFDISADLPQLSRTPVVVTCAGAKAILDLPATLEYLETLGVPVVGYQTDEFPAFYSRASGLPVSTRADSPQEVAEIARAHWDLGLDSAVLVVVPPPEDVALPVDAVSGAIEQALDEAQEQGVRGQKVTPFLLARVSELTGHASLRANLGLLHNNARVAARIAVAISKNRPLLAV